MEEGFGPYNFGFIEYTIKKIKVENHTLIIDGVNGLIMGELYYIGLRDRYIPDEKVIGGKVFGIRRKKLDDDYNLFRIHLDDSEIKYTDIVARDLDIISDQRIP